MDFLAVDKACHPAICNSDSANALSIAVMVVELLRVEVCVNCVLWCLGGSLHRAARFGDLYDTAWARSRWLAAIIVPVSRMEASLRKAVAYVGIET
jgi:hypothetical protein